MGKKKEKKARTQQENDRYCKAAGISSNQRAMLVTAWNWCDEEDKSTEFMFAYMSDMGNVGYDEVVDFVLNYTRTKADFE